MKLQVSINKKIGVINITSNSFILEDLKAHVCKKMKLKESDFKMKFDFGNSSIELVENVSSKVKKKPNKVISTIKSELKEYWHNLPMDCDANVTSIKGRELSVMEQQEKVSYQKYRRVFYKRDAYPYYIAMRRDSAKVDLLYWTTEEGDAFGTHFLFDMQSEESVKAFFESTEYVESRMLDMNGMEGNI